MLNRSILQNSDISISLFLAKSFDSQEAIKGSIISGTLVRMKFTSSYMYFLFLITTDLTCSPLGEKINSPNVILF